MGGNETMSAEMEKLEVSRSGPPESFSYFVRGLWEENAVFRQMLGMCPTLAVTAQLQPALTMGAATLFVLVCSSVVVLSLIHI